MARDDPRLDAATAPTGPGSRGGEPAARVGVTIGGKFVLREVVSSGGMGTVFRADQLTLGRTVAVKVLKAELARDEEMVRRFHAEARAASRLNHPNTISIIDFGQTPEGLLFLVMEFVRGCTLRDVLRDEFPIPRARLLELMRQLLEGLQEAHSQGVVHQDIKPDNVLIEQLSTGRDLLKLTDFGIARLRGEEPILDDDGLELVTGTPEYMAPEQILGVDIDARADVYAAGVLLYEMLTRERPFGGDATEVMDAQLHVPPPMESLRRPELDIPEALRAVVLRALAKHAAQRFASAAEFRVAIEAIAADSAQDGWRCRACAAAAPAGSQFCPACGARMAGPAGPAGEGAAPTLPAARPPHLWAGETPAVWRFPLSFVGRAAEVQRIDDVLAVRDRANSVTVVGPPGVGKSRLCEAVAARAAEAGYRVLAFGADAAGLAPSWQPVRAAVAALLDLPQGADQTAIEARLVTAGIEGHEARGLAELMGAGGGATGLELAVRRRECAAATLRVLRGATGWTPTLLIFEDVERYDRPSIELLQRLVEFPGQVAVHVLLTATPGSDLDGLEGPELIELEPLSYEAVREGISAAGGADFDVSTLYNDSGGVPLHVEQLLRLRLDGGVVGVGAALADLIDARVEALPPAARWALQAAAACGMQAPRHVVGALLRDEGDLGAAVGTLAERGLLRADGETLHFAHPLVQELVASGTPADVRRDLHARLRALLDRDGAPAAVVGYHGFEAGEHAGVVDRLERAGLEAQSLFDDAGAVIHYRRAWESARRALLAGDEGAEAVLGRLGVRLGDALRYSGDLAAAEGVLRETIDRCGAAPDLAARALRALGHVAAVGGQQPRSGLEHLRGAVALAMRTGDHQLLVESYLDLCALLERDGDVDAAVAEASEGLVLVTAGGGAHSTDGPAWTWRLVMRLAELHLRRGELAEALDHAVAALMQAERVASPIGTARAHSLLGTVLKECGRQEESLRYREKAVGLLRGLGDRRSTAELLLGLAGDDLAAGRSESARARLLEVLELALAVEWHDGSARAAAALRDLGQGP
ncbi:MAG: protein kinase [Deltaproteobacteria bacterium]|nr:protein kinase [Deltaproteobacteria bacterium]